MNLLLFSKDELEPDNQLVVADRRFRHLQNVLVSQAGDLVNVGEINGPKGQGRILEITETAARIQVELNSASPTPLPLTLLLALPRPKMLRRILQSVASLGVKEIHLINSYRVEKSFWQTPFLSERAVREQLCLGLEQSMDTVMPRVHLQKRFKPFVEDTLPDIVADKTALVAHPYNAQPCPVSLDSPAVLAIGPEGGFIPYEIEKLREIGFQPAALGARIMRVETAIPVVISRLYSGHFG